MANYTEILYEQDGPVVTITLNRPQKLNALTDEMMHELHEALDAIERDGSVRVVILTGAGRAFSAGYDLDYRDTPLVTMTDWRNHGIGSGLAVLKAMWNLRVPVITAVRGHVLGGGCDMMLVSDITVAAEGTKFGEPEVRGVSSPPTFMLPWVIGIKKAKELLLTGDSIDAQEALRLGMINKVVPDDRLMEESWALARKIAAVPPVSIRLNKRAINHQLEAQGLMNALDYGAEIFALLLLSEESKQFGQAVKEKGLRQALADRDAAFKK